jgi:hypothetical protein
MMRIGVSDCQVFGELRVRAEMARVSGVPDAFFGPFAI